MKQHRQKRMYEWLSIKNIRPDPNQPRKTFDPVKLEELRLSMEEHGMEQPIQVKKAKDGKYVIIAGERRWKCAGALGWAMMEAEIKPASTDTFKWALIENMVREDLNPMEVAEAIGRLKKDEGMSPSEISRCLGKDDSGYFVSSRLRLLELPDDLKKLVRNKELSETVALTFVRRSAGEGRRRADPEVIEKHFAALCDRVHGKTNITVSIAETYFDEVTAEKKQRRAPRKAATSAAVVRSRNGSSHVSERGELPIKEEQSPLRPTVIGQMEACLQVLDTLLGPEVKAPRFQKLWEELPRARQKELKELSAMLRVRLDRLDDLTKAKANGKAAHA